LREHGGMTDAILPDPAASGFRSAPYWEARYRGGGDSGAGSRGRLATYKAAVLNALIQDNAVGSAVEFGCGDGGQLALLSVRDYEGVDVSETALAMCRARFAGLPGRRFRHAAALEGLAAAELGLSLDVIYHLVEDAVFAAHMQALFAHAWRFVAIYASDVDAGWSSAHVRHRRFTPYVARHFPDWRLAAVLPHPYPFDPGRSDETSFAAFHIYRRPEEALRLGLPAVAG
jgi:SAM-dependent methyltransferase